MTAHQIHLDGITTQPLTEPAAEVGLSRIDPRFRPVWEGRSPAEQLALSRYFLPHKSSKPILVPTRPRVIKCYCPFAHQCAFPAGHRYCINIYTGCTHRCLYCYAAAYEPAHAGGKPDFAKALAKDLADLEAFDVPPAPVHISNSTDPFQSLEIRLGDTKRTLEGLLAHRRRFTTITLLTKNPSLAARMDYADLLRALAEIPAWHPFANRWKEINHPALQVEVSMAFWREEASAFWDPGAPTVASRTEGVRALRAADIPVVLRIDPLFPRSPLLIEGGKSLGDFGLLEAQTLDDLEQLVTFAAQVGARHIVYSTAKIVRSRYQPLPDAMRKLLEVYRALSAPGKPGWRGGSWRLPPKFADCFVTRPFLELCRQHGIAAKFCMKNLLETP
jgi:DNA repair photolyase